MSRKGMEIRRGARSDLEDETNPGVAHILMLRFLVEGVRQRDACHVPAAHVHDARATCHPCLGILSSFPGLTKAQVLV
jgi:hypothetical protein